MRPSILTGQVFVHKPAPDLLVTWQTSPAPGMIHPNRTWLPFSIADPLWITMLNGSVPLTPSDNCPLPAFLPCHRLYGSAAAGMTWCLP